MLWRGLGESLILARLFAVSLGIAAIAECAAAQRPESHPSPIAATESGRVPELEEEVLWWLPEDTEAVVMSRGHVPVGKIVPDKNAPATIMPVRPTISQRDESSKSLICDYQDLVAMNCITPLVGSNSLYPDDARDGLISSVFGPNTADLFVKAVWWNGGATREVCDIVVFCDNAASRMVAGLSRYPHTPRVVDGASVLEADLNHGLTAEMLRSSGIPFDLNDWGPPRPQPRYLAVHGAVGDWHVFRRVDSFGDSPVGRKHVPVPLVPAP